MPEPTQQELAAAAEIWESFERFLLGKKMGRTRDAQISDLVGIIASHRPQPSKGAWDYRVIDGKHCIGMAGNLDTIHDAQITVWPHTRDGADAVDLARRIVAALSPVCTSDEQIARDAAERALSLGWHTYHSDARRDDVVPAIGKMILSAITEAKAAHAEVMRQLLQIAEDAPELNMSNYDEDQVSQLNDAMIEVHRIATAAR